MLHGAARGIEVCLFDYQYTMGSSRHLQCWHQTAIGFCGLGLKLPDFGLRPRTWGRRFGPWMAEASLEVQIAYREIVFENQEKFSTRYQLYGRNGAEVRRLFTPARLEYFADHPEVSVEAHDNRLLVYWEAAPARPEAVRELMGKGFAILARMGWRGS